MSQGAIANDRDGVSVGLPGSSRTRTPPDGGLPNIYTSIFRSVKRESFADCSGIQ
ncbi:hypothetical protein ABH905_002509 [Pseudomonas frederiksbergensis]|jgi:hypothetical protein